MVDKLLTINEVCASLRISRSTLYNYLNRGDFPPPIRCLRRPRWRQSAINEFIAGGQADAE